MGKEHTATEHRGVYIRIPSNPLLVDARESALPNVSNYDGQVVEALWRPVEGLAVGDHVSDWEERDNRYFIKKGELEFEFPLNSKYQKLRWQHRGELLVVDLQEFGGSFADFRRVYGLEKALVGKKTVIIDLRNNSGGDIFLGENLAELFVGSINELNITFKKSHEMIKSKKFVSRWVIKHYLRKLDYGETIVRNRLKDNDLRKFSGRIVLLVNGFSYSMSGVFTGLLEKEAGNRLEIRGSAMGGGRCAFGNTIELFSPSRRVGLRLATIRAVPYTDDPAIEDEICKPVDVIDDTAPLREIINRELALLKKKP